MPNIYTLACTLSKCASACYLRKECTFITDGRCHEYCSTVTISGAPRYHCNQDAKFGPGKFNYRPSHNPSNHQHIFQQLSLQSNQPRVTHWSQIQQPPTRRTHMHTHTCTHTRTPHMHVRTSTSTHALTHSTHTSSNSSIHSKSYSKTLTGTGGGCSSGPCCSIRCVAPTVGLSHWVAPVGTCQ